MIFTSKNKNYQNPLSKKLPKCPYHSSETENQTMVTEKVDIKTSGRDESNDTGSESSHAVTAADWAPKVGKLGWLDGCGCSGFEGDNVRINRANRDPFWPRDFVH